MSNRLRDAFAQIHAEEELKSSTREFLAGRINGTQGEAVCKKRRTYGSIAAAACIAAALLGAGGYRLYFEPVTAIAMETQPPVSLGVNRFDRVVSVESDSREFLDAVNVKHCDYMDAVNRILSEESTADYLAQDEIVEISVTGGSEARNREILEGVEECAKRHENIRCYRGGEAEHRTEVQPEPGRHETEPEYKNKVQPESGHHGKHGANNSRHGHGRG